MQEPGATEVAEALARVYARPEFRTREPPRLIQRVLELVERAFEAFLDLMGRMLPGALTELAPFLTWVIVFVLVAAAVLAVWRLSEHYIDRGSKAGRATATAPAPAPRPRTAADWEALAAGAAARGSYREAALALYQAVLARLAERGALHLREGKTPGDYERELRRDPELSPAFRGFIGLLLPVAWGSRAPVAGDFEKLNLLAHRVERGGDSA